MECNFDFCSECGDFDEEYCDKIICYLCAENVGAAKVRLGRRPDHVDMAELRALFYTAIPSITDKVALNLALHLHKIPRETTLKVHFLLDFTGSMNSIVTESQGSRWNVLVSEVEAFCTSLREAITPNEESFNSVNASLSFYKFGNGPLTHEGDVTLDFASPPEAVTAELATLHEKLRNSTPNRGPTHFDEALKDFFDGPEPRITPGDPVMNVVAFFSDGKDYHAAETEALLSSHPAVPSVAFFTFLIGPRASVSGLRNMAESGRNGGMKVVGGNGADDDGVADGLRQLSGLLLRSPYNVHVSLEPGKNIKRLLTPHSVLAGHQEALKRLEYHPGQKDGSLVGVDYPLISGSITDTLAFVEFKRRGVIGTMFTAGFVRVQVSITAAPGTHWDGRLEQIEFIRNVLVWNNPEHIPRVSFVISERDQTAEIEDPDPTDGEQESSGEERDLFEVARAPSPGKKKKRGKRIKKSKSPSPQKANNDGGWHLSIDNLSLKTPAPPPGMYIALVIGTGPPPLPQSGSLPQPPTGPANVRLLANTNHPPPPPSSAAAHGSGPGLVSSPPPRPGPSSSGKMSSRRPGQRSRSRSRSHSHGSQSRGREGGRPAVPARDEDKENLKAEVKRLQQSLQATKTYWQGLANHNGQLGLVISQVFLHLDQAALGTELALRAASDTRYKSSDEDMANAAIKDLQKCSDEWVDAVDSLASAGGQESPLKRMGATFLGYLDKKRGEILGTSESWKTALGVLDLMTGVPAGMLIHGVTTFASFARFHTNQAALSKRTAKDAWTATRTAWQSVEGVTMIADHWASLNQPGKGRKMSPEYFGYAAALAAWQLILEDLPLDGFRKQLDVTLRTLPPPASPTTRKSSSSSKGKKAKTADDG